MTPASLPEIRPSRNEQKISAEQVAEWEKRWGSKVERVEDAASLGKVYTAAEQLAAQPNSQPLGPTDPLPATLIKGTTRPGQPMLVSIPIKMQ